MRYAELFRKGTEENKRDTTMKHFYIGIDPGKSGAWAILEDGVTVHNAKLFTEDIGYETLIDEIALLQFGEHMISAGIEKLSARPGQNVSAGGRMMEEYGRIQGILTGVKQSYILVHPATWASVVKDVAFKGQQTKGLPPKEKARVEGRNRQLRKQHTVDFVLRKFPDAASYLKRKKDRDIADAICIAKYCEMQGF